LSYYITIFRNILKFYCNANNRKGGIKCAQRNRNANSALSSEPFELLPDPTSVKDIAEARERKGYQRYLNTYFSEIKPGYPGALFSRTATNIPDKKGGGERKKKSRQKKQHRRRNRRHSTRKYRK
jgi:hypothetical protein